MLVVPAIPIAAGVVGASVEKPTTLSVPRETPSGGIAARACGCEVATKPDIIGPVVVASESRRGAVPLKLTRRTVIHSAASVALAPALDILRPRGAAAQTAGNAPEWRHALSLFDEVFAG